METRAALLLWLLVVSACATADRDTADVSDTDSRSASSAPEPSPSFASPQVIGVAPRFAPTVEADEWTVGNELVYGIKLVGPQGVRQWLIRVTVISPPEEYEAGSAPFQQTISTEVEDYRFESRAVALEIATYDGAGLKEQNGVYRVPADFLGHGLFPGLALAVDRQDDELPEVTGGESSRRLREVQETMLRSSAAWLGLFSFAQANPSLSPIVDVVIAKPSLLEVILRGFKIDVGANADFSRSRRVEPFPGIPGDVRSMPFEVRVYDAQALVGTIYVARSLPPIMPGAGIVAVRAWHPEDARRVVSIRLLSATLPSAAAAREP